jgi:D-glycero-alpha-D-manno-heptose-7-phosphate kinase
MIIAKAPLRISIGGGGTDLPSYYENFGSEFISAAINKYVYIAVHKIFIPDIIVKYSQFERVDKVDDVKHPIIRECLREAGVGEAVEISSFADIPSGTGLGSSSTFTVALLKALFTFTNRIHSNHEIAEIACDIEINRLGAPIGKQDQFISAFGGITRFEIDKTGLVKAIPVRMTPAAKTDLEEHLLLFFTGYTRSANEILEEQDQATKKAVGQSPASKDMLDNLHFVRELGVQIGRSIQAGDLNEFARLMDVHWEYKKKRSKNMSNGKIDEWYELSKKNGALGGKLIGAGGGGFLMFLADDKRRLRKAMREAGLEDVPFKFDELGAQVVLRD